MRCYSGQYERIVVNDKRSTWSQILAAVGTLLILIALVLPVLPWLQYTDPAIGRERAPLDDRALAEALITVPVSRGANGTQPDDRLILGDADYRMGDIAQLFDLELPFPAVYTRREFQVTAAQLAEIHPEGRQPSLPALAAHGEDVVVPLRAILDHSELALPRPSLHETAAAWVDLADLLDLLSIAIPLQALLDALELSLPLSEERATESEISLAQLAELAGIQWPESTGDIAISLAQLFTLASVPLPLEESSRIALYLNLRELNRLAGLGWDAATWAGVEGADVWIAAVLEEARLAIPQETTRIERSALELLDDYLLREPGWFSLSLVLALLACTFTLFLPALGRGWFLWLAALCTAPALIWLPAHIHAQNPLAWNTNRLISSLAAGYWLAWLGVILVTIDTIGRRMRFRPAE